MLWLSDEAIEYAVKICRRKQNYKVGIVLQNELRILDLEDCLRDCLRDREDFQIHRSRGCLMIEFCNGSYIKTMLATNNSRGHRVNLLIADENIDDEILDYVFRYCETLDNIERRNQRYSNTLAREEVLSYYHWGREFFYEDNDEEIADVSESELMKLLNIAIPQ